MDINLIELIEAVKNRPLLWDKTDKDYNNRHAAAQAWDDLEQKFDRDKSYVKSKWHNLRTQFKRELRKLIIPYGKPKKPVMDYYRGQWVHFEKMMFLKETLLLQPESTTPNRIDISECDLKEEVEEISEDENHLPQEEYYESDASKSNEADIQMPKPFVEPKKEMSEDYVVQEVDSRKRKPVSDNNCDVQAKICKTSEEVDDDLYFMKSLMPFFKKLSPVRKLLVRNEIQNLLIRESLYDNCNCHQKRSCHANGNIYQ